MMNTRESGGVIALGLGLVLLIGAIRGTWAKVWHDLFTGDGSNSGSNGGGNGTPGSARPAGPVRVGPDPGLPTPGGIVAAGNASIFDPTALAQTAWGDRSLFQGDSNAGIGTGRGTMFTPGEKTLWTGPTNQMELLQA